MMKSLKSILRELDRIIATKSPRATMHALNHCHQQLTSREFACAITQEFKLSHDEIKAILSKTTLLRNSRCRGRYHFEAEVLNSLYHHTSHAVCFDDPHDWDGSLISDYQVPKPEISEKNLAIFETLADHSLALLTSKLRKLQHHDQLMQSAFQLLEKLLHRKELIEYHQKAVSFVRNEILTKDLEYASCAITYIFSFYHSYTPEEKELKSFASQLQDLNDRTKHRAVKCHLLDLFVDHGVTDELSALDEMERFDDYYWGEEEDF